MDGNNVFSDSLSQFLHYLNSQNQQNAAAGSGGGNQPIKVVTQVHYANPNDQANAANAANATPAVPTGPPAPFTPPQSTPQTALPAQNVGQFAAGAPQAGGGQTQSLGQLPGGGAGGPGSGQPTSNAISGITGALSKGLSNAASAIGGVNTMPTPIQSGPFPTINQATPTLIGRRTQQPTGGFA